MFLRSALVLVVSLATSGVVFAAEPLRAVHEAALRSAARDKPTQGELSPAERAARGYRLLTTKAYLPPDFDQETFDQLWQSWEPAQRERARKATLDERRQMTFARYGLTGPPEGQGPPKKNPASTHSNPVQYVVDPQGRWTMNCLACHQGKIAGRVIPGVPNTGFALATLTDEIRATKLQQGKPLSRMDVGSLFMPLGNTRGTTNAVMFGVILMNYRDAELEVHTDRHRPEMVHHDLDAPAWWHFHRKQNLYYDGFVPKNHRALMQFLMVRENGPEKFHEWEADYRDIMAWIDQLRPPKYPFAIDKPLAAQGELVFNQRCATCHGTYGRGPDGRGPTYPNRLVPLARLGTDPIRLTALSSEHRQAYAASWFNEFGRQPVETKPEGYVAPPLDGIWASAPYLHNGSVPTLWHLLHPAERPTVWRRIPEGREQELEGYDQHRVGLRVETLAEVPPAASSLRQRREYFDTRGRSKSAAGHLFPDQLTEPQKRAVLEYLKML